MSKRYFIGRDGSGHEYIVPADKRGDFYDWADLPDVDERSWEPPEYARRINKAGWTFGSPQDFE